MEDLEKNPSWAAEQSFTLLSHYLTSGCDNNLESTRVLNPIYLLGECPSGCPLSRIKQPTLRTEFEKRASNLIKNKADLLQSKPVNVILFAAGRLLTEMRILIQAIKKGVKAINVHIIDPQHAAYKSGVEQHALIKKKAFSLKYEDRSRAASHETLSQFVHWFAYRYPDVIVKIFSYGNIQSYIHRYYSNACQNNSVFSLADVILGIDFDDMAAVQQGSLLDFYYLLRFVHTRNAISSGIFLNRNLLIMASKPVNLDAKSSKEEQEKALADTATAAAGTAATTDKAFSK